MRDREQHGLRQLPEYDIWANMIQRCKNPNHIVYAKYGGSGIKVCERWSSSFQNFINDMGLRTDKSHSIDRLDRKGNYCPENCAWVDREAQMRNRSNTVMSEEIVGEVRLLLAQGYFDKKGSRKAFALQHGFKPVTLHAVLSGRNWAEIKPSKELKIFKGL